MIVQLETEDEPPHILDTRGSYGIGEILFYLDEVPTINALFSPYYSNKQCVGCV